MGDWFRAAGYHTHYRGKWHVSHADLVIPGTHESLTANDADGVVDAAAVDAYRRADRLDPFGFSGWIGREPHGADKADTGLVRDGVFAEQVVELFGKLAAGRRRRPVAGGGLVREPARHRVLRRGVEAPRVPADRPTVPDVPEAPSQSDSFDGRPTASAQFRDVWPQMLYPQPTDGAYRRLYHLLHKLVDAAIVRILDALDASGIADDTIVVFTSDHGDLLGAHGGLHAEVAQRVRRGRSACRCSCPGRASTPTPTACTIPTSHVDVLPTLLGLAGVDVEAAAAGGGRAPRRRPNRSSGATSGSSRARRDRRRRSTRRCTS